MGARTVICFVYAGKERLYVGGLDRRLNEAMGAERSGCVIRDGVIRG